MKKSFFYGLVTLIAFTFVLSSCNKYEEGANFSLLPAKTRLVNTWTLNTYKVGSTTQTIDNTTLEIKKDDTGVFTYTSGSSSTTDDGMWSFNSNKTTVTLTDFTFYGGTWTIVKLKNKELKLRKSDTVFGGEVISELSFTGE